MLYAELVYYVNYCLLLTNAELGYYVNYYCLLLTCKVICPDLRGMACWHPLQLAGRAMTCIHWLSRDLRLWLWALALFWFTSLEMQYWKLRMLNILYTSFFSHWWTTFLSLTCYFYIQGSYVYDINGNKYLDSLAGLWCTALGMGTRFCDNETPFISAPLVMSELLLLRSGGSEPRLVKAATDQLNKLPFYHSFWNRTTRPSLVYFLESFIK